MQNILVAPGVDRETIYDKLHVAQLAVIDEPPHVLLERRWWNKKRLESPLVEVIQHDLCHRNITMGQRLSAHTPASSTRQDKAIIRLQLKRWVQAVESNHSWTLRRYQARCNRTRKTSL